MFADLRKLIARIIVAPWFSLVVTAVLAVLSQYAPLLPGTSVELRNSLTIVIIFAGLALCWYVSVHHAIRDTHEEMANLILKEVDSGYSAVRKTVEETHQSLSQSIVARVDELMTGRRAIIHESWNANYVAKVMKETTRCDDREPNAEQEDIRISTTGFNVFPEDDLSDVLRGGVRVKVLVLDPSRRDLIRARNKGRTDGETEEKARGAIVFQIGRMLDQSVFPSRAFELKLSDMMPFGFVLHTKRKALLGLMLGHTSYSRGPMIEVDSTEPLWKALRDDWDVRWRQGLEPDASKFS
jgi:hypothetical protein